MNKLYNCSAAPRWLWVKVLKGPGEVKSDFEL